MLGRGYLRGFRKIFLILLVGLIAALLVSSVQAGNSANIIAAPSDNATTVPADNITAAPSDNITSVPSDNVTTAPSDNITTPLEDAQNNLTEYMEKLELKQEINSQERQIEVLNGSITRLKAEQQNLGKEIGDFNETMRKLGQMEGDPILKVVTLLFFFSLAGFISSLLFINLIWRVKIKGIGE